MAALNEKHRPSGVDRRVHRKENGKKVSYDYIDNLPKYNKHQEFREASKFQRIQLVRYAQPKVTLDDGRRGEYISTVLKNGQVERDKTFVQEGWPIVKNTNGPEMWAIDPKTFQKKYVPTEQEGIYKPKGGPMNASQPLKRKTAFAAPWGGDMYMDKGSRILQDPNNPKDTYGIGGQEFDDTYKFINESVIRNIVAESLKNFFGGKKKEPKKKFEGKELNWTLHTTGMNSTVYLKGFADSEEWINKDRVVIRCKSIVLGNARKYKLTNVEITIINSSNVLVSGVNEETGENLSFKRLILDKTSLMENFTGEYRTKGSLNKKTLEKQMAQADKTSGAASLEPKKPEEVKVPQYGEEGYNPDWDDYSYDNIKGMYGDDEEEFDDSQAGGEYKIDQSNPYFYTKDGKEEDADAIGQFHNNYAIVKKGGKVNYINSNGVIISDEWFDACNDFECGFGMVAKDMKRNFVNGNGELLLDTWVDRAGDFIGGEAPVIINGQRYSVDRSGNIK